MGYRKYWIHVIDLKNSMIYFELGACSEGYKGNGNYQNKEQIFY